VIKSIRHIRGTAAEWSANDAVIPEGEIALLKMRNGRFKARIGDGVSPFSKLSSIDGDAIREASGSITAEHGKLYRLGTLTGLELTLPTDPDDDFYTEISFSSGNDATEFISNTAVRFTGDDIAAEEFIPRERTHYNLFIWYDGEYQGVARGIADA
jgi:hypothetical protein